ncbi:MAG: hypothetical protein OEL54_06660 [Flavobacteriaceae bacterium]|nr:hypothetical protein [Flavobacteriaceae bacterium]
MIRKQQIFLILTFKKESTLSLDIIKVVHNNRELEQYKDPDRLKNESVPYIGQVKQHKSDPDKLFLKVDPLSSHGPLLEFNTRDIVYAEEVSTLSNNEGAAYRIVKIWVKKGSVAIKLSPFIVSNFPSSTTAHYTE